MRTYAGNDGMSAAAGRRCRGDWKGLRSGQGPKGSGRDCRRRFGPCRHRTPVPMFGFRPVDAAWRDCATITGGHTERICRPASVRKATAELETAKCTSQPASARISASHRRPARFHGGLRNSFRPCRPHSRSRQNASGRAFRVRMAAEGFGVKSQPELHAALVMCSVELREKRS